MNEQVIWDYLSAKIKNDIGVAALMGNLYAESSLKPVIANGIKKYGMTSEEYTAVVDAGKNDNFVTDGIAYGLVQWCYHTRKKGLLNKARANKKSVGDLYLQLDYMWEELQAYKIVLNSLLNATDIRETSDVVMLKYEKPANTKEEAKQKRAKYAQKYYDMFSGKNNEIVLDKTIAKDIFKELKGQL